MDIFSGTQEVIVAVIDGGVSFDHPEILPSLWINGGEIPDNSIDDDANGYIDDVLGWDFITDDNIPLDNVGHGTLIASIIGAARNNGEGIAGISNTAKIMPLSTCGSNGCLTSAFLSATTYAANNGAKVINYSVGGSFYNNTERAQIQWLDTQGVLFVTSAGNGGYDLIGDDNDVTPNYPASYDVNNILSVAAIDRSNSLSSFSNYGLTSVDIAVPGSSIYGADVRLVTKFYEDFETGASGWLQGHESDSESTLNWTLHVDGYSDTWLTDSVDLSHAPIEYVVNTNSWAKMPEITLGVSSRLEFTAWHQLEYYFDNLFIEVSTDETNWEILEYITGNSGTACPSCSLYAGSVYSIDLSEYELQTIYLRYRMKSDNSINDDGVYIDDISIREIGVFSYDGTQYRYNNGTSFAAPIVSGIAALLISQRPDLTHDHVKQILLESVDLVPELNGKLVTGGTANAYKALNRAIAFNTGILQFDTDNISIDEDGNNVTVTVSRTGGTDGEVSVEYSTDNGSATAGQDYVSTSGTLMFADGEYSKSFSVSITDDGIEESSETINVTLGHVVGATLSSANSAVITVNDDDIVIEPGVLQLNSSTYAVEENVGTISITVMRSNGADGTVSVQYSTSDGSATAGQDYVSTSGTLTFSDGEYSKSFSVSITDDSIDESSETINVTLSHVVGATLSSANSAVITVNDDDVVIEPGVLQLNSSTYAVQENVGTIIITVVRFSGADGTVSVQYSTSDGSATAGQDYVSTSGMLTFTDGQTNKSFSVSITDDSLDEADETINVTLSKVTGAALGSQITAEIVIGDDDESESGNTTEDESTDGESASNELSGGGSSGGGFMSIWIIAILSFIYFRRRLQTQQIV